MNHNIEKIAVFLFIIVTLLFSMYRGSLDDLKDCKKWSQKAYNLLSQEKKNELNKEIKEERDMMEDIATSREDSRY